MVELTDGSTFVTVGPENTETFEQTLLDNDIVPNFEQKPRATCSISQ